MRSWAKPCGISPTSLKTANRDIPRTTMPAVRNRIAHDYFGIDDTILFATIAEEVKELLPRIEALARQHDVKI
jgi:uncharacterized protein with HEPN domain